MKKVFGLIVAGVIALGVVGAQAGGACCGAGKASVDKAGGDCSAMYSKLNLTDEQKTKMTELRAEAKKAATPADAQAIMTAGLEKILTPEQLAQCKADCKKDMPAGGCPFMKAEKKD